MTDINKKNFGEQVRNRKLKPVTIDIDYCLIDKENRQDSSVKDNYPDKPDNPCFNIQFAYSDEIKDFLMRFDSLEYTCKQIVQYGCRWKS